MGKKVYSDMIWYGLGRLCNWYLLWSLVVLFCLVNCVHHLLISLYITEKW